MNFDTQNWEPFRKDFETESRLTIDRHPSNRLIRDTGIITRYCQEAQDETKYLSYSDVNWNDITFLDIKSTTFDLSGMYQYDPTNKITFEKSTFGEHVLNKIFSNSQKYYIIHYVDTDDGHGKVKNKFYDYFNKMDDPPLLFLEYHFYCEEDVIDFKKNMNMDRFANIYFQKISHEHDNRKS